MELGLPLSWRLGRGATVGSPKILIVDDDLESRNLLSEVLQANGYAVGAVADGAAAREELGRDGEYQIILADLRMPKESGLDLLRNLRQQNARYTVILMSSFISGTERKLAQELGAHALLEKPFRLSELLQIVGELAGKPLVSLSPGERTGATPGSKIGQEERR
jgi:DNA-binding response OmpR family regulator